MGINWPKPFTFNDGRKVLSTEDWNERADEILNEYQSEMYGYIRTGEDIDYEISDKGAVLVSFFGTKEVPEAKKMTVKVSKNGRCAQFDVAVFLPKQKIAEKSPVFICMHPIQPIEYANMHGYAVIVMNPTAIASDDIKHNGCFYELYPYGTAAEEQTGVLAAWGWGASKILDALYAGAGESLDIDPDNAIVTGVSRWGKATAVCGAFDKRFKMVAPSCSGAGGLALYRYFSEGKTYDFSSKGVDTLYTYGQNEPLSCLQSDAERGWFNDRFLDYKSPEQIPLEQYMLPALCARKDRYYFVIASCISEDWVNAPSMWLCFRAAERIYDFLGLSDNLAANFHKEGHAVIEEDMALMIEFFNEKVYGIKSEKDLSVLKTSVFEEKANYDPLFGEIGASVSSM